jgi:hypothetical protein
MFAHRQLFTTNLVISIQARLPHNGHPRVFQVTD